MTTDELDRSYRLRRDERAPDGIRRIVEGQLASAREQLEDVEPGWLGESVHATRKHLKRLRAALRLTRDAIAPETYERENGSFRVAGQRLSAGRDSAVIIQTLDELHERFPDALAPEATAALRERLVQERADAYVALDEPEGGREAALGTISDAQARTAGWLFPQDGVEALSPGLKRIYLRGRKRMDRAGDEPTSENLHEARKRVKDLWHAAQILRPAAPKRMKRLADDAHDVADLLGDEHDLAVLRDHVERHPQCFEDEDSKDALVGLIERRRRALRRKALKRGRRLYTRSPKKFIAAIERGWRKRVEPKPLSG